MLGLSRNTHGLFASYTDKYDRPKLVNLSGLSALSQIDSDIFINPILDYISRLSESSYKNYLGVLSDLGEIFLENALTSLPTEEGEWQELIMIIHNHIIHNPNSKANLKSRVLGHLQPTFTLLYHLQDEGVIPLGVEFPATCKNFELIDYSRQLKDLLGNNSAEIVETFSSKLLCDITLSRNDADYLDSIHAELSRRRKILFEVLTSYWQSFKEHVDLGKELIANENVESILNRIKCFGTREKGNFRNTHGEHYLSLSCLEGLARYLALANYQGGLPSFKQTKKDKIFPQKVQLVDLELKFPFPNNTNTHRNTFTHLRLMWLMGRVTHRDIAMFSALLIMENPSFTPMGVTEAKLLDKEGKKYFELGEGGETFIIHKHRAKSVKKEFLSKTSVEIISFVSDLLAPYREELKVSGSPLSDYLFLPFSQNGDRIATPNHSLLASYLSGTTCKTDGLWLGNMYPQLEKYGLTRGSISLKKFRNTEGVLEWFRTGSVKAMAKKLGNKYSTTITYYLPPQLIAAWNTRLIRRFQNLWIVVASAKEQFLLEVTDFNSLSELHSFITQMLIQHPPTSSPLAAKLHESFAENNQITLQKDALSASISVSISVNSLAALYLYQEKAMEVIIDKHLFQEIDSETGLNPQYFVDMANLLKMKLFNHVNPEYQTIHFKALELTSCLVKTVNWDQLFIKQDK